MRSSRLGRQVRAREGYELAGDGRCRVVRVFSSSSPYLVYGLIVDVD